MEKPTMETVNELMLYALIVLIVIGGVKVAKAGSKMIDRLYRSNKQSIIHNNQD
jgi:hypothetical protein